jgi:hypothetical protein
MKQNVRFIDQIKVGSYAIIPEEDNSIIVENDVDNYVLTATGVKGFIRGEPNLYFDGYSLGLGSQIPLARFELKGDDSLSDLLLITNYLNQGVKINAEGVTELIEYTTTPESKIGGIIYSGSNFWVGL